MSVNCQNDFVCKTEESCNVSPPFRSHQWSNVSTQRHNSFTCAIHNKCNSTCSNLLVFHQVFQIIWLQTYKLYTLIHCQSAEVVSKANIYWLLGLQNNYYSTQRCNFFCVQHVTIAVKPIDKPLGYGTNLWKVHSITSLKPLRGFGFNPKLVSLNRLRPKKNTVRPWNSSLAK